VYFPLNSPLERGWGVFGVVEGIFNKSYGKVVTHPAPIAIGAPLWRGELI